LVVAKAKKAIPGPPFHLGHRRGGRELKVAELPAGFEAGVDEAAIDGKDLQRTDDFVSGARLRSPLASNAG
jgi:hypothetical protein